LDTITLKKLVKLQDAYEKTNIALDASSEKSISSQLQDRHHETREIWDMVLPYFSKKRSDKIVRIENVGEKINKYYIDFARAKQSGKKYTIENTDEFSSLLYEYHRETRKMISDEIADVIEILEEAIEK
jgi:hypothetical protein